MVHFLLILLALTQKDRDKSISLLLKNFTEALLVLLPLLEEILQFRMALTAA